MKFLILFIIIWFLGAYIGVNPYARVNPETKLLEINFNGFTK